MAATERAVPPATDDGSRAAAKTASGPRAWLETMKAAFKRFQADNGTDRAAALTYYSVLALFPALLVLVALFGVLGQYPETTDSLLRIVGDLGPSSAVDNLSGPIEDITRNSGGAGALLSFGLIGALLSASGYLGAFARASNVIYDAEEERPFWKMRPQQAGMTLLLLVMLALVLIGLVLSGPVARSVGDTVGVGSSAVTVWGIAKWPVMIVLVSLIIATLYWWAPDVDGHRFRLFTVGSVFAVLVWIAASALFAFYVTNFGSYNATYGSFAGVIIFLLWIWITNNAILLGQELNAELERQRKIERGVPWAEEQIQGSPKDQSAIDTTGS